MPGSRAFAALALVAAASTATAVLPVLPSAAGPSTALASAARSAQAVDEGPSTGEDGSDAGALPPVTVAADDPVVERVIEGESLLPPTAQTAPARAQDNCCSLVWSGDRQLWLQPTEAGGSITSTVDVPQDGTYALAADLTTARDYGILQLTVDGQPQGDPFDGYRASGVVVERRVDLGTVALTAGQHEITFTVTGKNPSATGLFAGIDVLRLRAVPQDPRLALTPADGAPVNGVVPVLGVSSAGDDVLTLAVDGETATSRPALAGSASPIYQAQGLQAGRSAGFNDRLVVRDVEIPIGSDVNAGSSLGSTSFGTDSVDIPGELVTPGQTVVTIATGTAPDETNGNHDDFDVRNVRLQLPDGTILSPAEGAGEVKLGDGCCPDPSSTLPKQVDFTFTIPPSAPAGPDYDPARAFAWDTTALSDGEHTITLSAEGSSGPAAITHTVLVDNAGPSITATSPAEGERVKGDFRLDVESTDDTGSGVVSETATLDGEPVTVPSTLSSDDLVDGAHTAVFTVTDGAGNQSTRAVAFTSVAETPDPPQLIGPADGARDVPRNPELRVRATDPAGDPLEVTFLEASKTTPQVGSSSTGQSPTAPPAAPAPEGETPLGADDVQAASASDDVYAEAAPSEEFPYQRYDLRVERTRGDVTAVDVTWEGRTAPDREVVLSVWDLQQQAWTPVASGRGATDGDLTLIGAVDLARTCDGDVVHVLVQGSDPFAEVQSTADATFEDPADYDFSLAWLTDTQYLSQGAANGREEFAEAYRGINQWIVDNADERKIAYTAHTGDLIESYFHQTEAVARPEFEFASETMKILERAGMPYGVIPGNHDNVRGANHDLYNEYFGPARFDAAEETAARGEDGEGYYGGSYQPEDNQNHFDLIEAGGQKLIVVYMGYVFGQEEIDWANQVLAQHADRKAIFATHEYLEPSPNPDGREGELTPLNALSSGQRLFDEVVMPNKNVFLTLSGHTHGVALNIKRDVGEQGRTIVEMLANYQFYEVEGQRRTGFFRLLQVDVDTSEIAVNTYSPALNEHNADEYDTASRYVPAADEFVTPVDLASRVTSFGTDAVALAVRTDRIIGTDAVASGDEAATTWRGLPPGGDYAWFARAADEFGAVQDSAVFSFTTAGPPGRGRDGSAASGSRTAREGGPASNRR